MPRSTFPTLLGIALLTTTLYADPINESPIDLKQDPGYKQFSFCFEQSPEDKQKCCSRFVTQKFEETCANDPEGDDTENTTPTVNE